MWYLGGFALAVFVAALMVFFLVYGARRDWIDLYDDYDEDEDNLA